MHSISTTAASPPAQRPWSRNGVRSMFCSIQ